MRSSPFGTGTATLRVFIKALFIFIVGNGLLLVVQFDPVAAITQINTWGLSGHTGTKRLMVPDAYLHGQLPLEGLIAAHEIAYKPKVADEFRVIVLGDSAQWGALLNDSETFTAQLTDRHLLINGKRLVAYNLAYPGPSAVRDVFILDAVLDYKPDLIIWFQTATSLTAPQNGFNGDHLTFYQLNGMRVDRIVQRYDQRWLYKMLVPRSVWSSTLAVPVWIDSLTYPFMPAIVQPPYPSEQRILHRSIPEKAEVYDDFPGMKPLPNDTWQFLLIGKAMAERVGAHLLLVNEPMFIGTGANSDTNYNELIARGMYDHYRAALTDFVRVNSIPFADLWDAIPPEHFTNTPLHADAEGWTLVVNRITDVLTKQMAITR